MNAIKKMTSVFLVLLIGFAGCATELNETQAGALGGSALGAGLGAIIGNQTGHAGAGTAIGSGVGLLTGALVGEGMRRQGEKVKRELREEQYYAQQQQAAPVRTGQTQEVHTKYNPRTGQTFPERFQYDPNTGEELVRLQ